MKIFQNKPCERPILLCKPSKIPFSTSHCVGTHWTNSYNNCSVSGYGCLSEADDERCLQFPQLWSFQPSHFQQRLWQCPSSHCCPTDWPVVSQSGTLQEYNVKTGSRFQTLKFVFFLIFLLSKKSVLIYFYLKKQLSINKLYNLKQYCFFSYTVIAMSKK